MIKQPVLLVVSGICLIAALWLVIDRSIFLWSAEETVGTVVDVIGSNGRCGRKRSRYSCTRYSANVEYESQTGAHVLTISAGSARGHNQPASSARVQKESPVPIVYAPNRPDRAYEDTVFGVWGAPLIAGFIQIATLLGSLTEGRRRRLL